MTRKYDTEGPGSSAGGGEDGVGYYYEQDPSRMATEDLRTVKDSDENNYDDADME